MDVLDQLKALVVLAGGAVLLLYVGAKIERAKLKAQLEVLDGQPEVSGGGRA